ncbi:MAG: hypothetical protein R2705_20820 [Ilumatobacteraceae bacterium]
MPCIHVEREEPGIELLVDLTTVIGMLRDEAETSHDPVVQKLLAAHRSWLRGLPRLALVRVALFGAEPLRPGLCDVVGIGLLGHAPYEIARPAERHELDLALQMIDDRRVGTWGATPEGLDAELRSCSSRPTSVRSYACR